MLYDLSEGNAVQFGGLSITLVQAGQGRACLKAELLPQVEGSKVRAAGNSPPLRKHIERSKGLTPAGAVG